MSAARAWCSSASRAPARAPRRHAWRSTSTSSTSRPARSSATRPRWGPAGGSRPRPTWTGASSSPTTSSSAWSRSGSADAAEVEHGFVLDGFPRTAPPGPGARPDPRRSAAASTWSSTSTSRPRSCCIASPGAGCVRAAAPTITSTTLLRSLGVRRVRRRRAPARRRHRGVDRCGGSSSTSSRPSRSSSSTARQAVLVHVDGTSERDEVFKKCLALVDDRFDPSSS